MFQTLLIPTAIPHRCSLSSFIGLYLSICPPPPALIYSFPILWKHTPSCARAPSALRFPAAPAASEIRQLALLKGVYTCSGPPRPCNCRLICMWMLVGGWYEIWTCNAAGVFGVCVYACAYAHGYYSGKLGIDLCFLWQICLWACMCIYMRFGCACCWCNR